MSMPLTWADVDDEQPWESDKFTQMDEIVYEAGFDQPPPKEKSADQIYMETLDELDTDKSTAARLQRVDLMAHHMTEQQLREGRIEGVSKKWVHTGQESSAPKDKAGYVSRSTYDNDDSEDDDDDLFADDDEVIQRQLEELRKHRLQELRISHTLAAGVLIDVTPETFYEHVKQPSKHGIVFMLIYKEFHQGCEIMLKHLTKLAKKYPNVKFTKMLASKQIERFDDSVCPCIMVYEHEKVIGQYEKFDKYGGGTKCTTEDIEWTFAKNKLLNSDLTEDPREAALFNE